MQDNIPPAAGVSVTDADSFVMLDDFADNKLSSRDYFQPRPEWATKLGSPSVGGGVATIPNGHIVDQVIATPSTFIIGSWEITHNFVNNTLGKFRFHVFADADDINDLNGYFANRNCTNPDYPYFRLYSQTGSSIASIISSQPAIDTDPHIFKITRDVSGNWEIFLDGVSEGTVTNIVHSTANYLLLSNDYTTDEDVYSQVDNLEVKS